MYVCFVFDQYNYIKLDIYSVNSLKQ